MQVLDFEPAHLEQITLQPMQAAVGQQFCEEYAEGLLLGPAFTVLGAEGVVACVGYMKQWEGRYFAWALIGENAGPYFFGMIRKIRRYFDEAPVRRLETAVPVDWEAGERFAYLLGFQREGRMRKWSPDGKDFDLWARCQNG